MTDRSTPPSRADLERALEDAEKLRQHLTEAQTTIATLTQERDALLDQVLRQVDALYLLLTADPHTTAVTFKAIRRLGSDLADLRAQPPADQG